MTNHNDGKKCPRCKTIKEKVEFSKNKTKKDGLSDWCKYCCGQQQKKNVAKKYALKHNLPIGVRLLRERGRRPDGVAKSSVSELDTGHSLRILSKKTTAVAIKRSKRQKLIAKYGIDLVETMESTEQGIWEPYDF